MIRPSDLHIASGWARPAATPSRSEAQDPSAWFDGNDPSVQEPIGADLSPASRGLSVQQHASRVLAFLCGDGEVRP